MSPAGMIGLIVALLIAAMVLLLLEILTPMFGLFIAAALAAMAAAVWMTFTLSEFAGFVLIIALAVLVPVYLVFLVRRLPRSKLAGRMFLPAAPDSTGDGQPEAADLARLVGQTGTTLSPLRPSGAVRIDDRRITALAEGGQIDEGVQVKVIRFDGMDAIVQPVPKENTTQ